MPRAPTGDERATIEAQRGAWVAMQVAEALPLIQEISRRSPDIRKRVSLAWYDLKFKKPSSEQYQYIKKNLDAAQRTHVASALEEMIKNPAHLPNGMRAGQAVAVWNSIQHTRLRVHTPEDARHFRRTSAFNTYVVTPLFLGGTAGLLAPIPMLANHHQRKNYFRGEARPEYVDAFNSIMRMLCAPEIPHEHKRTIAGMFLDQHMRQEGTIGVAERDPLLQGLALRAGAARKAIPSPRGMSPVEAVDLQDRLIAHVTATNFRHQEWPAGVRHDEGVDAHANSEIRGARPLDENIANIFFLANQHQRAQGLEEFAIPNDIKQYNGLPNADAFSAVLQRLSNFELVTQRRGTERGQQADGVMPQLALQGVQIIRALEDPVVRQKIFDEAVGGPRSCNNNTREVFSRLGKLAAESQMVRDIESGRISPAEAARLAIQLSRQEALENFLDGEFLHQTARGRLAQKKKVAPELVLSTKAKLKRVMDLPDNIATLEVPFWAPTHQDLESALDHVQALEHRDAGNVGSTDFHLYKSPSWRQAVIAMVERSNPKDFMMLQAFKHPELFERVVDESADKGEVAAMVHQGTGDRLSHVGALQAQRAYDTLSQFDVPGDHESGGQEFTEALSRQFNALQSALVDVEIQLAAHVSSSLLGPARARSVNDGSLSFTPGIVVRPDARLPDDGNFKPTFTLPDDWDHQVERLNALALPLDIARTVERIKDHEQRIVQAASDIQQLRNAPALQCLPADATSYAVQQGLSRLHGHLLAQDEVILKPKHHDAKLNALTQDQQFAWRVAVGDLCRVTNGLRQSRHAVQENQKNLEALLARQRRDQPATADRPHRNKGKEKA